MKSVSPIAVSQPRRWITPLILALVLGGLFWRSFLPDYVHFSNDGPLGQQNVDWLRLPSALFGTWADLNVIGSSGGAFALSVGTALSWLLGPVGYAKFLAPLALFIVGLGAWFFFRQLKLSPLAAMLGALAAMLNSTFFSDACWGVASHETALGMNFFALGLMTANTKETPGIIRWVRLALAGLCVGINVMEGADVGALYSMLVAAFVFFKALTVEDGPIVNRLIKGISHVAIVAVFAGFIAMQTVLGLISTQIQGIAGTGQDAETKAQHWDFATQWSLPKIETLNLIIPGLFGYKMDTPQNMMPALQDAYRGGVYWGGIGRTPELDRYFDSGATGSPPPGTMRFSGGGNYCGILVIMIAAWTIAQSFRRLNSPFAAIQKKYIWFWSAVLFGSLLMAWGRFAPFYALPYQLPYFSTIRNPAKFLFFFSWAIVILFGFGVHALGRRYLETSVVKSYGLLTQLINWWSKSGKFDRRWTYVCTSIFFVSVLGWFIYASEKPALVRYLQARGYPDEDYAQHIIAFSIGQAGWWLALFVVAIILFTLVIAGYFAGPRAKMGGLLLGAFLIFDLGRANLPYIIHWDYKQKYEVGSLNPIEKILADKPYEHRVALLPFETQQHLRDYDDYFGGSGLYRIEWAQHHFPYYNIQSLDVIQMPRKPADLEAFDTALAFSTPARRWELTNTRYLLGPIGFLLALNEQLDPLKQRFHVAQRFDVIAKPNVAQISGLEQLTARIDSDGELAIFDFAGALPRAKLYSNWQITTVNPATLEQWVKTIQQRVPQEMADALTQCSTNDLATLYTLADTNFDAWETVLLTKLLPTSPIRMTNENSGTVEFNSYAPKKIVLTAHALTPSVLLLNDKYDPNWHVSVDGKPAELLRCNYIMRGVYLPAGAHTVEFKFSLPSGPLYITLTAIGVGIFLLGFLILSGSRNQTTVIKS